MNYKPEQKLRIKLLMPESYSTKVYKKKMYIMSDRKRNVKIQNWTDLNEKFLLKYRGRLLPRLYKLYKLCKIV